MSNEQNQSAPHEHEEPSEPRYEPVLEQLGFEIPPELVEITSALRIALVDDGFDPESLRQLWTEYGLLLETLIDGIDDSDKQQKAQIGAIIHKAFLFRDAAMTLRYLEELTQAEIYAGNAAFDPENPNIMKDPALYALSNLLASEIDSKCAMLEPSPERLILQLRGKISDDNQLQLWDLWAEEEDQEDLVNHAYEMLLDAGEDPDEVLRELGILE